MDSLRIYGHYAPTFACNCSLEACAVSFAWSRNRSECLLRTWSAFVDTVGLGVSRSRYSAILRMLSMHLYAIACIILCRLAIDDTRSATVGCISGPDIHLAFVMVIGHLTGSNEWPWCLDSGFRLFACSRHLAIYMACPSYYSSSIVCGFSEQLHTFCPPAFICIYVA